jgi:hypothetical protein
MARRLSSAGLLVAAALCLAAAAPAVRGGESLGEAARREQERRANAPKPDDVPTLTNDDLEGAKGRGTFSTPGTATAASAPAAVAAEDDEMDRRAEERKTREAEWRRRFADARQQLEEAEARAWQDVVEPVLVGGGNGPAYFVNMKVRKFVETEELRLARQAIVDLEDELRRAGAPAGWGRE